MLRDEAAGRTDRVQSVAASPAWHAPSPDPIALLEQRTVINTATGVLMVQHERGAQAAYVLLAGRARESGTSPYAVAAQVISALG